MITSTSTDVSLPTKQWTIRALLGVTTQYLKQRGSPSARLDAELMLAEALKYKRVQLYIEIDKPLSEAERDSYREMVRRRGLGEPVAYIIGTRSFWKYDFEVNEHVLIPRPDTELIIEEVLDESKKLSWIPTRILDVGSGSGCLTVCLANEFKDSVVTGWDLSVDAIEVATRNAEKMNAENVVFDQVDILQDSSWLTDERFDLIVANPPYISLQEKEMLDRSVLNFEPHIALFAGVDGLSFYRQIAQQAKNVLSPGGLIFIEIGLGQAPKVSELFEEYNWKIERSCSDLAGIERVLVFKVDEGVS